MPTDHRGVRTRTPTAIPLRDPTPPHATRDHELVFASPSGEPWNPDRIGQAFARAIERTKLPRIRLHDLRHTHATHLLAAGVNARIVSEHLGHSTVAFTLGVYGHVMPGQQADAAAAVAALIDA